MNTRISDKRIAELKYDESVLNSRANRDGVPKKPTISRCNCGNSGCGGAVWNQDDNHRTNIEWNNIAKSREMLNKNNGL